MSDPSLLPEGSGEIAKLAGSGVGGSVVTMFLSRLFKSQDKTNDQILAEMKVLTANVAALTLAVGLLGRTVTDVARLEETVAAQGLELAGLKATIAELKDGLLR